MAPPWHRRLRALRGAVCAPAAGERPCIAPCPAAGAAEPRGLTADELATYEEDVRAPLPTPAPHRVHTIVHTGLRLRPRPAH